MKHTHVQPSKGGLWRGCLCLGGLWCGDLPLSVGQEAQDTARCTYIAGHVQGAAYSVDTFTPLGAVRCPRALRNRQGQDSTCPGSPGTQSLWLHRYILKGQIIKIFMKTKKKIEVEIVEESILDHQEVFLSSVEASTEEGRDIFA